MTSECLIVWRLNCVYNRWINEVHTDVLLAHSALYWLKLHMHRCLCHRLYFPGWGTYVSDCTCVCSPQIVLNSSSDTSCDIVPLIALKRLKPGRAEVQVQVQLRSSRKCQCLDTWSLFLSIVIDPQPLLICVNPQSVCQLHCLCSSNLNTDPESEMTLKNTGSNNFI